MAAFLVSVFSLLPPQALLDSLLYQGQFPEVVLVADSLLEYFPADTPLQILAYRYRAFALVALGDTTMALNSFLRLLELRPCLELDPFATSPPVWQIFRRAKEQVPCPGPRIDPAVVDSLRKRVSDLERYLEALRRNLFLPGRGQRFLGRQEKGSWLTRLWLLSLGGWGASWWAYDRARKDYLRMTDPEKAQKAYQVVNRWYRLRTFFGAAALGIYLYAIVDLF